MPLKTNHLTTHGRDHTVEVYLSRFWCPCFAVVTRVGLESSTQPGSVSSERFLLIYSCPLFQMHFPNQALDFKPILLTEKSRIWRVKNSNILWVWSTRKNFLCSVCRCWCVHEDRNAGWNDDLPVVQCRGFINVAFPHVQPPSASPSPSCITELGWGDKKGMDLYVFMHCFPSYSNFFAKNEQQLTRKAKVWGIPT